ncbi:MAG: 50S ribosomal protein L9 [bacterium]
MKVIFLQDVPRVGRKYDVKEVNDGYAMNFLLPRKFAELATVKSIAALELRQKEIKVEREVRDDLLMKNLEAIKDKVVTLSEKADETGHLFKGRARERNRGSHACPAPCGNQRRIPQDRKAYQRSGRARHPNRYQGQEIILQAGHRAGLAFLTDMWYE